MKRISVDYENNANAWWEDARQQLDQAPANVRARLMPLLEPLGPAQIDVADSTAEAIVDWAESLEGWDDGPDYAPHPLLAQDVTAE